MRRIRYAAGLACLVVACSEDAKPQGPPVDLPEGACGRALFVLSTEYETTSVSIVGWDGEVKSAGILRSNSESPGLSVALSGDVVAPTDRVSTGQILLIDRYPASVITLFDPATSSVVRQINVMTRSNPHDALFARPDALYVTRYERKVDAGKEPFDEGSDVLVIDPGSGQITGRIDLAPAMTGAPADIEPHPDRMVLRDGKVHVLLAAYSANYQKSDDARIVTIDPTTHAITGHTVITASRGCAGLAATQDGARFAIACSGTFGGQLTPTLDGAGIAIVDRMADGSYAVSSFIGADALASAPPSFSLDFASPDRLLVATFGELDPTGDVLRTDRLYEVDIPSATARELAASDGEAFALGDVRCAPGCGTCVVADASRGGVLRLPIQEDGSLGAYELVPVDDGYGLPPRYLGAY
jgi:DNA-binding beta-propeller fold protein YncE